MRLQRIIEQKGSVLVLTLFAMPVALGMLTLVVDTGWLAVARAKAQATVDSMALAGSSDAVRNGFASVVTLQDALDLNLTDVWVVHAWSHSVDLDDPSRVTCDLTLLVPPIFGGLWGLHGYTINVRATAANRRLVK